MFSALLFNSREWPENYLLVSIIIFIALAFLFLILLFASRLKHIYHARLLRLYTPIIDKLLFSILFNSKLSVAEVIESPKYQKYYRAKNFQKILLYNITQLHENYSGDYNMRLEEFYRKTDLIKVSFAKLASHPWEQKCEGVRELSEMNIKEAFFDIHKCVWHKKNILKLEAILGLIRLEGLKGLFVLKDYTEPINDWIQLNIMYEIDNTNLAAVKNFSALLTSPNETVVILGLRLIAKFNQIENIEEIMEIKNSEASSYRLKYQAQKALERLPSLKIYNRVIDDN